MVDKNEKKELSESELNNIKEVVKSEILECIDYIFDNGGYYKRVLNSKGGESGFGLEDLEKDLNNMKSDKGREILENEIKRMKSERSKELFKKYMVIFSDGLNIKMGSKKKKK